MTTSDTEILASLRNSDMRDAHRLYNAAMLVVSLGSLFPESALRAVAAALADEARNPCEEHEREAMMAMASYLATEAGIR
jgi:aspartyl/asparaginyl beta-hydroxylase (cupin superfamily)